ncbi:MAG: hypothetical protein KKF50_00390 [Nanoarchaeota archaeon]|nr:hypothetical protein [Nanoarchaeota archaeon]
MKSTSFGSLGSAGYTGKLFRLLDCVTVVACTDFSKGVVDFSMSLGVNNATPITIPVAIYFAFIIWDELESI